MGDRTQKVLFAAALAFAAAMGAFYLATLRRPATAPEPPVPVAASATPAEAKPPPTRPPRAQPRRPTPARSALSPETEWESEPPAPANQVTVTGKVFDERGSPAGGVMVRHKSGGTTSGTRSNSDGSFRFEATGDRIEVWAERKDGSLVARSDRVVVDGSKGGEWEVDLLLQSTRQAGLGVKVGPHADGLYIRQVMPGTPAQDLGLVRGDVIVEVDGEPMAGLSVSEITARLTGAEGSSQRFAVRHRDGSEEVMDFERRPINGK